LLNSVTDYVEIRKLLFRTLLFVSIILSLIFVPVFLFRDLLIELLYSEDFLVAADFIFLVLISDFIKFMSWPFAFFLLLKRQKLYMVVEILAAVVTVLLTIVLIRKCGLSGVFFSSIIVNVFYAFMVGFQVKRILAIKDSRCR
jgi:O-antigen/teichoic acid export membrane protein